MMAGKSGIRLISVDFEVFGKVQGVFFRKSTKEQGTALGVRGWCMNTRDGTVRGTIEGEADKIEQMKSWLKTKGSQLSVIEKAEFKNEKEISNYTFDSFEIKR